MATASTKGVAQSTATIKFGKGYDAPWLVANGTPAEIRGQLIEAFGIEQDDDIASLSLAELIVSVSRTALAVFNTASTLGAKPVRAERTGPSPAASEVWKQAQGKIDGTPATEGQPATAAPQENDDPPFEADDPLIVQIRNASTKKALALIWRANQAEFTRPEIQAAMAEAQAKAA